MTVLLIDDLRNFKVSRDEVIARNLEEAFAYLRSDPTRHYTEIWLDHDLGPGDPATRVLDYMNERAFNDDPVSVDIVLVHTSNNVGAKTFIAGLHRYGYNAVKVQAADWFEVQEHLHTDL